VSTARTILVVDDEQAIREVVEAMLVSVGFDVVLAGDSTEALERFQAAPDRFDTVLLDATVPGPAGADTAQELRRIRPGVRILLSSGFTEQEVARRIHMDSRDSFIKKPYRMQELLAALERLLAG
jgi:two-component system cell cycle sensor histidine kinase/response regulator CckA